MALRLPDFQALGERPDLSAGQRPLATVDTSGYGKGLASLGAGLAGAGDSLFKIAGREADRQNADERLRANSYLVEGDNKIESAFDVDPDWQTWQPRYTEQKKKNLDAAAALITNPREREHFLLRAAPYQAASQRRMDQRYRQRYNHETDNEFQTKTVPEFLEAARRATTPEEKDFLLNQNLAPKIQRLVEAGVLTPTQGEDRKRAIGDAVVSQEFSKLPYEQQVRALKAAMGIGDKTAPTDIEAAARSIRTIESGSPGGNYKAIGPMVLKNGDRAYGAYQVMGNNVGPWTQKHFGQRLTPQEFLNNPEAQDAVFRGEFGGYMRKYGPEGAARAWFGGEGAINAPGRKDVLGTNVGGYGSNFSALFRKHGGGAQRPEVESEYLPGEPRATQPAAPASVPERMASMLSPAARIALLDRAEIGMRRKQVVDAQTKFDLEARIKDDAQRINDTGEPDPKITFDEVSRTLGAGRALKWQQDRRFMTGLYAATVDFDSLTPAEMQERLRALQPDPAAVGSDGYAGKLALFEAVRKRVEDREAKLMSSPAEAVDNSAEVSAVRKKFEGDLDKPLVQHALIDARIAAQRRMGVPDGLIQAVPAADLKPWVSVLRPVAGRQADLMEQRKVFDAFTDEVFTKYGNNAEAVVKQVLRSLSLSENSADVLSAAIRRSREANAYGPLIPTEDMMRMKRDEYDSFLRQAVGGATDVGGAAFDAGPPMLSDMLPGEPQVAGPSLDEAADVGDAGFPTEVGARVDGRVGGGAGAAGEVTSGLRKPFAEAIRMLNSDPEKLIGPYVERFGMENVPIQFKGIADAYMDEKAKAGTERAKLDVGLPQGRPLPMGPGGNPVQPPAAPKPDKKAEKTLEKSGQQLAEMIDEDPVAVLPMAALKLGRLPQALVQKYGTVGDGDNDIPAIRSIGEAVELARREPERYLPAFLLLFGEHELPDDLRAVAKRVMDPTRGRTVGSF